MATLAQHVMPAAPARPVGPRSTSQVSQPLDAAHLSSWVRSCAGRARVTQLHAAPRTEVEHLLGSLVGSIEPIAEDAAIALGVPPRTPVGQAASLLLWAVQDPTGPRCRSYLSAVGFLGDRAAQALPPAVKATAPWRQPRVDA